jgi:hypothetical protein
LCPPPRAVLMERGCRLVEQRWAQKDVPTLHAYANYLGKSYYFSAMSG